MTDVKEIDAQTAHDWAAAGEAVLLDVREDDEVRMAAIPGAVHNPMSRFDFDNIPGGDGKKLVVFCAHGMRSLQVADHLLRQGKITEAYSMAGGIADWGGLGLPVE